MDIVHHALIGGAGFLAANTAGEPLAGVAFVAGSVFPDLDALFMLFGRRFYLQNHQGITHSLPLAPLYAAALCGAFALLPEISWSWGMFVAALTGILLHVALDWLNTFRISLWAPFSWRRYSADALFFIDAVTLGLSALFYLSYALYGVTAASWTYPAIFTMYLGAKLWLRRRVGRALEPLHAIPSSLNPLQFYVLAAHGSGHAGYLYNALTGNKSRWREYPPVAPRYLALAESSPLFCDMRKITRALQIIEVKEDASGTTIVAADVAVRNFGGRFGQTVLRFDGNGKLVHEVANI